MPSALDQPRQGLERELEALLVHQPAHEQHEPLVGRREARAQRVQVVHRHELGWVDPVRDHVHAALLEPVDVRHVLAHVRGAGDQALGAVGHPALDAVDVGLRVLVDPALVAAVLGGVDGHHERRSEALGEVVTRRGHEPVMAVDHVEVVAVPHLHAGGEHVRVHVLDPGHELAQVARALRLANAVHEHTARPPPRRDPPRARGRARARRPPGPPCSRPACARGARARPRSAAGTPRTG